MEAWLARLRELSGGIFLDRLQMVD